MRREASLFETAHVSKRLLRLDFRIPAYSVTGPSGGSKAGGFWLRSSRMTARFTESQFESRETLRQSGGYGHVTIKRRRVD